MDYLNIFFVYSILGHLLETIVNPKTNSGILYGYWTPIYGIGVEIIILSYTFLNNRLKLKGPLKFILTFLIGFIFLSTIEFIGGTLIEIIFHRTFWDYSKMKFHIGKYTSLEMALLWGLASLSVIYIIHPLLKKFIQKIPKFLTYIASFLFLIDIFLTIFIKAK